MRVLLDENLPRRLTREFADDVEARTVGQQGWKGTQNGKLLRRAEAEFEVFVTTDQGIPHQQNLSEIRLAIVILEARSNRLTDLQPLMQRVNRQIRDVTDGAVVRISP